MADVGVGTESTVGGTKTLGAPEYWSWLKVLLLGLTWPFEVVFVADMRAKSSACVADDAEAAARKAGEVGVEP